jgi:hypothetical protein
MCPASHGADRVATHQGKAAGGKLYNFPLTNIKLAVKPVSRWVYGYEPLDSKRILDDTEEYLKELEKRMEQADKLKGLHLEDDKRFANTLQFFIQLLLAAEHHNRQALKLEHRLARIQAKHPEFMDYTKDWRSPRLVGRPVDLKLTDRR